MSAALSTQQPNVSLTMLKALLSHFRQSDQLLSYLPVATVEKLRSCSAPERFSLPELFDAKLWLSSIHYSWLASYLQQLPPQLLSNYLAILPPPISKPLAEQLKCSISPQPPPPSIQVFLLALLKQNMKIQNVLPLPLLPSSALKVLLKIPESSLLILIDYLGLHDLAAETKQVVDKQILGKIENALNPSERKFLAYCTQQLILWVPPKFNLKNWNGDRNTLHNLLHARGITRLAKATITQDPNFRWHLVHRLDINRGKLLIDAYKAPIDRMLISYFQKQVLELLERLKS